MLTEVQVCKDAENNVTVSEMVDLEHSSLSLHFKVDLTFCYYREYDARITFAGMWDAFGRLKVFVKLCDEEPVDLAPSEWQAQWSRFPELIPRDI